MSVLGKVYEIIRTTTKYFYIFASSLVRCHIFFSTLSLTCLILCAGSCYLTKDNDSSRLTLQLGDNLNSHLTVNQTYQYQITLNSQMYVKLTVDCQGHPISATVLSPDGQRLKTHQCTPSQSAVLSMIAPSSGIYRIETRLSDLSNSPAELRIKVLEIRLSTPEDIHQTHAENLFAEAVSSKWNQELNLAVPIIKKLEDVQQFWKKRGEKEEEATALKAIGDIYQELEDYQQARQRYDTALQLVSVSGGILKCQVLNKLSQVEVMLEKSDESVFHAEAALKLADALNYLPGKAQAWDNIGAIAIQSGKSSDALEILQKALQVWEHLNFPRELANTHSKLVSVYAGLYDLENARIHFNEAVRFWEICNDKIGQTRVTTIMGNLYSLLGEKQEARNLYRRAEEILQKTKNKEELARLYAGMGFFFKGIGDYESTLKYYQQTQQLRQQLKQETQEAGMLIVIGNTYHQMEQHMPAAESYQKALSLLSGKTVPIYLAHVFKGLGLIEFSHKNYRKAANYSLRALQHLRTAKNPRAEADVLTEIGNIYFERKQYQHSIDSYQQALNINRRIGARLEIIQTLYYLAKVENTLGRVTSSLQLIEEAIEIIETLRAKIISPQNRITYFSSVHRCYKLYIDITIELAQKYPNQGFIAKSLSITESARSRALLELLNEARFSIRQGVTPQFLQEEKLLLQSINRLAEEEMKLQDKPEKREERNELQQKIKSAKGQLDELQEKMRFTNPRVAALRQPHPLDAKGVQQLLDDDTMLLEYALGDERSYLWAVTNHSIDAYILPNRATIEPLVRNLSQLLTASPQQEGETIAQWHHRNMQANEQYWLRAAELSQMILGAVADKLGNKRLVIVGDGALQLLPFAALPSPLRVASSELRMKPKPSKPETQNSQPLIFDHEITNLPSASSLKLLREDRVKPPPPNGVFARWTHALRSWLGSDDEPASIRSVAILADPVFGLEDKRVKGKEASTAQTNQPQTRDVDLSNDNVYLPRLIATREEAEEIQKVAAPNAVLLKQGFAVNRSLLESDELKRYGIVHFATHGFWDSANPEMSGIVLSRFDAQGNPLDGILRLSDIYNLQLPKELVVLSACETAVGKDIRGEGLVALTRGFMYAGAARVMASLWKVDDNATAEMMKIFYQHLLQDKKSPAAALRAAQIAMWQKAPNQMPNDWAAFVLQGEYR